MRLIRHIPAALILFQWLEKAAGPGNPIHQLLYPLPSCNL